MVLSSKWGFSLSLAYSKMWLNYLQSQELPERDAYINACLVLYFKLKLSGFLRLSSYSDLVNGIVCLTSFRLNY